MASNNPMYPINADGSSATSTQPQVTIATSNDKISNDEFLKLLVAQMQYQDPMNPVSNTDFLAQLAQINTLQQAQATAQTQRLGEAAALMGRRVVYLNTDRQAILDATVMEVDVEDSEPQMVVSGKDPSTGATVTATIGFDSLRKILPDATPTAGSGSNTGGQ